MTSLAPKPGVRGSGGYLMKILSNLTIEPAFFIMSVSIALEQIATQQMVVLKSCKIDFNYTDEICNNLQSENYTEENAQISAEVRFSIFKILPIKNNFFSAGQFQFLWTGHSECISSIFCLLFRSMGRQIWQETDFLPFLDCNHHFTNHSGFLCCVL